MLPFQLSFAMVKYRHMWETEDERMLADEGLQVADFDYSSHISNSMAKLCKDCKRNKEPSVDCSTFRELPNSHTLMNPGAGVKLPERVSREHLLKFSNLQLVLRCTSLYHNYTSQRKYTTRAGKARSSTYYYDILDIPPEVNQSEIKAAYYAKSKLYHPDINKSHNTAVMFNKISEAYEILGNVRKRREYDRGIMHRGGPRSRNASAAASDEDYHSFIRREQFKSRPRTPYTGRSPIYDYDTHYRMHYSYDRRKARATQEQWSEFRQNRQSDREFAAAILYLGLGVWFFWMATMLFTRTGTIKDKNLKK